MSTSQSTLDFLLDQLADCGAVTARKMFGEYCLYYAGRPVGLVCDDRHSLCQLVRATADALSLVKPPAAAKSRRSKPKGGVGMAD